MKLEFELLKDFPDESDEVDFYHFPNENGAFLYLNNGHFYSHAFKFPKSDYVFSNDLGSFHLGGGGLDVFECLTIKKLDRYGLIGSFRIGDEHYVILFELTVDVSDLLSGGSITEVRNNPIRQLQLNLVNAKSDDGSFGKNMLVNEDKSFALPGSRLELWIEAGGEEQNFGSFYLDRTSWDVLSSSAGLEARSITGRKLKDKAIFAGGESEPQAWNLPVLIEGLIAGLAGMSKEDFSVPHIDKWVMIEANPETDLLSVLLQVIEREGWSVKETLSGKVVVGKFENTRVDLDYGKLFKREIVLDDSEVYRGVYVWTSVEGESKRRYIYKEIEKNVLYSLENGKTLFVQIADNSSVNELETVAKELMKRIESSGRVEELTCVFAPWIETGDEIFINGVSCGIVSRINHRFGSGGVFTDMTLDSSGSLQSVSLKDYLQVLSRETRRVKLGGA